MALDYTLKEPSERVECVKQLLEETPTENLTNKYLNYMSDYILFVADKNQTKKERKASHPIVTKNREVTVDKRQVSFEEVVANLENGEDGLYALISNDKNQILDNREPLSQDDIDNIPGIKEHLNLIERLKVQFAQASGARKYSLKRQIIETWQQIYIIKASAKGVPGKGRMSAQIKSMVHMNLDESITFDDNGFPQSDGIISFFNPAHVSFLLTYYSQLKQESYEELHSDMHWLLLDFENIVEQALRDKPVYYDLLIWKIDGYTNEDIQHMMESKYGINHTAQYFSTLWRNKIPKLIVEQAQKHYVTWYYTTQEYGVWKKCNKCGKTKLAHPLFFSKNTSKDGYYSVCKECRTKK